jgi:hypothetical protein
VSELANIEAKLDEATTALLPPLRATKHLDPQAFAELIGVLDELAPILAVDELVSRRLVGKLWFVFTAMLTEAEYAREPEALLDAAWSYQERLRSIFGPSFS